MFTWGCNDEGALGRETKDGEEYSPELVSSLKGVNIIQLSAGNSHTAALAASGEVYCWGVFRVSSMCKYYVSLSPIIWILIKVSCL